MRFVMIFFLTPLTGLFYHLLLSIRYFGYDPSLFNERLSNYETKQLFLRGRFQTSSRTKSMDCSLEIILHYNQSKKTKVYNLIMMENLLKCFLDSKSNRVSRQPSRQRITWSAKSWWVLMITL